MNLPKGNSPAFHAASCRHGVEAGSYCAKCGREIVTGPVIKPNDALRREQR